MSAGLRMATSLSKRTLIGCVAENNHKYLSQALRLVQSVRWFAGALRDADVIVCVVGGIESSFRRKLERFGARIRIVSSFDPANPLFNKIQAFRVPDVDGYDALLYLDCDTVVVQDPSPFLEPSVLQIKAADVPTVPTEVLERLCRHFGFEPPERLFRTTLDRVPTVWYCNAGVVACPTTFIPGLIPAWCRYELEFTQNPDLLGPYQKHRSQAALAIAFMKDPVPFQELPVSMNFPLHLTHLDAPREMAQADPVILHYHDRVDFAGFLRPSPYPLAQKRIETFNSRLSSTERLQVSGAVVEANGRSDGTAASGSSVEPLVVCVAGMHRSGTSMVARMLHTCGINVGPEQELAMPAPDNEEGFWENADFVSLNDSLLKQLGGSWDNAPAEPRRWESDELGALRDRALELIRKNDHAPWGWKDPRSSLTLPFWKQLLPALKVVICLRNPLEVAQSLATRDPAVLDPHLRLWSTYYRRALAAVPPEDRVITHYSVYFDDAHLELQRVLRLLSFSASDELIETACSTVSSRLRHHQVTTRELAQAGVPDDVIADYVAMCSEALMEARDGDLEWLRRELRARDEQLASLNAVLEVRDRDLEWLKNEMKVVEKEIARLGALIEARDRELASLRPVIRLRNALRKIKRRLTKTADRAGSPLL
jgi:hypothetical protein